MISKYTVLLFIAIIALSQCQLINSNSGSKLKDKTHVAQKLKCGYQLKSQSELAKLKSNGNFKNTIKEVRDYWRNTMSQILGDVVSVEDKVGDGKTIKVTFKVKTGNTQSTVQITLQTQTGSSKLFISQTVPKIPGLNKSVDLTEIAKKKLAAAKAKNGQKVPANPHPQNKTNSTQKPIPASTKKAVPPANQKATKIKTDPAHQQKAVQKPAQTSFTIPYIFQGASAFSMPVQPAKPANKTPAKL